eukprot:TRINITY_DN553_c0_g3_i1.p2 TRINITY_DN553_c0_g3~~TRINITY_DN553_c0_g3_i1.p2  ORF type:complete len:165 (-),score=15.95 TRINITY_DN553_c0_g3_i1:1270-1764(-)
MANLVTSLLTKTRCLSATRLHLASKRKYSDIQNMREYVRQQRAAKNGASTTTTPKPAQPLPKPTVKSPLNSTNAPTVITVAVTGDVAQKSRVNVPISPKEQIEQIIASYEAGARMVHVHVRDENGKPTWDPKKYAEVLEGSRKYCPDMLLQFTTGNYGTLYHIW